MNEARCLDEAIRGVEDKIAEIEEKAAALRALQAVAEGDDHREISRMLRHCEGAVEWGYEELWRLHQNALVADVERTIREL